MQQKAVCQMAVALDPPIPVSASVSFGQLVDSFEATTWSRAVWVSCCSVLTYMVLVLLGSIQWPTKTLFFPAESLAGVSATV